MFAEDVDLLPDNMFTRMLEHARNRPEEFELLAQDLFGAMSTGGRIGFERVAWFNGGLFDDDTALPLDKDAIDTALRAAALDWSEIDPSIFGTLFERGLDPDKRSQLGAHYTDRDKIMRIVEPVIVRPILAEWEEAKTEIAAAVERAAAARSKGARTRQWARADRDLHTFLDRLRGFTVLDPACGSGNFLYLALHALKDLEHRIQLEAEALGLQRGFPSVGPANVRGIEINAYAAELARVSIWIGEIQWMRRNGFTEDRDPILKPLETIECRDAILAPDGREPDWPKADVVIGNPPFLGDRVMRGDLGHSYTEKLRSTYQARVPPAADLVCYWFYKAGSLLANGAIFRGGLVATNSIRGGKNRLVLDRLCDIGTIFDAWADEPWVIDGASVRVSLVCFAAKDAKHPVFLNGEETARIHADLTKGGIDITAAAPLKTNRATAFLGVYKNGPFDIPGQQAREWLRLPANPNGRPNSDVLKPRMNGMDLTRRPAGNWIVDFGEEMGEADSALYEEPFAYILEHVKPVRLSRRRKRHRTFWWRHGETRPGMWSAIDGLSRFIATPTVSKHRLFVWLDAGGLSRPPANCGRSR